MQLLGIKFVPLDIPMRRRLETLAAGMAIATMIFGGAVGTICLIYLMFYTHHWPEVIFYVIWAYVIDKDTPDQGGRAIDCVRGWAWWRYMTDYFPIRLERVPWIELDPKRNYLFCCFPHGILPLGVFSGFASSSGRFRDLFPNHTPYTLTLKQNFYFPLLRELLLWTGMVSSSAKSINYLLGYPGGGKAAALVVGGAAETFNCKPGDYHIVLKKRKGFIKIALSHGSPIVPVFSFGETDVFNQLDNPEGSLLRRVQEWLKNVTGIVFAVPVGRGFFQYSFGMVPLRKPIHTIVGKPIEVVKTTNPTQEQIDKLHQEFMNQLMELFEEQKYTYLPNADQVSLIIN